MAATEQSQVVQSQTEEIRGPRLGLVGSLRWAWRQLTSMRTALVLLMLLAIATIPGSVWPQRNVDPPAVREYIENNPTLGAWLDRLWLFDVYSSPWFSAIYLLLVISLIGCIIPRTRLHLRAMRAQPPRTPRNLRRLTAHRTLRVQASPERATEVARAVLGRRRRFRLRAQDPARPHEVAAENGFLRETGNLIFHISLLGVILSFAAGHLWGWRGEIIIAEGETFTSTAGLYHTLEPGAWVDTTDLDPWVLTLDSFTAEFDTQPGPNFGAPTLFRGEVTIADAPGEPTRQETIGVNNPLQIGSTSVYLLGNGYAPVFTVRDGDGEVVYSQATPFLAQDDFYASTGAIKVTGPEPGLGFHGAFLPTIYFDPEFGPVSRYPDLFEPAVVLAVFEGDLYPDGRPQSVYTLDTSGMEQLTRPDGEPVRIVLAPGGTYELSDGRGTLSFDGVVRWAGLVMREDPGRGPVLVSALVLLAGLMAMLFVQRRRVFVRASLIDPSGPISTVAGGPDAENHGDTGHTETGHTEIVIGALAKGSDPGLERLLDDLADRFGDLLEVDESDSIEGPEQDDPETTGARGASTTKDE